MNITTSMTKITFENEEGSYSISVPREGMTTDEVVESLLIPVLMAAGYGDDSIKHAFNNQDVV